MTTPPLTAAVPTHAQAQQLIRQQLKAAGITSADSEAQQLLSGVLGLTRVQLITRAGQLLTPDQWHTLQDLAQRRSQREPLQHLLGQVEWADLVLSVSPAALIPRPETEVLLELACQEVRRLALPSPRLLDVGTGTGALALALKHRFPAAQVTASDISLPALALARHNAQQSHLHIDLVHSDLLTDLTGPYAAPFDLLVSNPPYLPASDQPSAQPEVQYDPALALYGGPDGLSLARRLCQQAPAVLAAGAPLLLELDPRNALTLTQELRAQGWSAYLEPDLTGRERFVVAHLPHTDSE